MGERDLPIEGVRWGVGFLARWFNSTVKNVLLGSAVWGWRGDRGTSPGREGTGGS